LPRRADYRNGTASCWSSCSAPRNDFPKKAAEEQLLRAAFTGAGYQPRWDLLPVPGVLGAILVLGREAEWESQISEYRRFLQQRGLLQ
jgi:hypothetical protein